MSIDGNGSRPEDPNAGETIQIDAIVPVGFKVVAKAIILIGADGRQHVNAPFDNPPLALRLAAKLVTVTAEKIIQEATKQQSSISLVPPGMKIPPFSRGLG